MRRSGVLAVCWLAVASAVAACGVGPSVRPDVAVVQNDPGHPVVTETAAPGGPELDAPEPGNDLPWRDCTAETLATYGLPAGPTGLVLECAETPTPVDADGSVPGSFPLGIMRARVADTPDDVAPLVLTTGSDMASTRALAALATGPLSGTLASRPVVAVDRRGTGNSQPIDCIFPPDRRSLADLGEFGPGGRSPQRVAELGQAATISCTDYLQPQELMFSSAHAADDLEQLRAVWGIDRIALLGIGNGTSVALAYAAEHPETVGRLVLDSPAAATGDAELLAESRARGAEGAVNAFVRQCIALDCSLGPDPRAAIEDLHTKALAGALAPVSSNALTTALTAALGTPAADLQSHVRELSDVLAAARDGDVLPLLDLVSPAEELLSTDGQWVSRCSDGQRWPTATRAEELQREWAAAYPLFGSDVAIGTTSCAAWPSMPASPLPTEFEVPVLVTSGAADPIVGAGGLDTVTGVLTAGGATWSALAWQGAGYSAVLHSSCVQDRLETYLASGALPPNGSMCPA